MEIEAKFSVLGSLDPEQISQLRTAPYHLEDRGSEHHFDEVLDTPTRALTTTKHALRLRRTEHGTLVTLKGANSSSGGMHAREEIEAPLPDGVETDVSRWPQEVAERVVPMLNGAKLAPLVRVDVDRHTWNVTRNGHLIAEVALDDGTIFGGERAMPLHELEVELKEQGSQDDLDALVARLQDALPLYPESRSKLERGLALLRPAEVAGTVTLADVTREALLKQLRRLDKALPVAQAGEDPEGVHDVRVAVRRMRTMLDVLAGAPGADRRSLTELRRRLRKPARRLGTVRDLDVLLERVAAYTTDHPQHAADIERFRRVLEARRQRAREKMLDYLGSGALTAILQEVDTFASGEPQFGQDGEQTTVAQFAGGAIWVRYEEVLQFGSAVRERDVERLHALRIACKHLRYTLEFFEEELGTGAEVLIEALRRSQDELGSLHDAVVTHDLLEAVIAKHGDSDGLVAYAADLITERERRIDAAKPVWRQLSGSIFRQQLASLIGGL